MNIEEFYGSFRFLLYNNLEKSIFGGIYMIRHLRLQFICVIMVIVPLMLVVIFGIVINMTSSSMEMQSISMMQTIAASPFQLGSLGIPSQEVSPPSSSPGRTQLP